MNYDKEYLYNFYNATSTDDGTGEIETYESWLERQLISRLKRIDELEKFIPNELKGVSNNELTQEVCDACESKYTVKMPCGTIYCYDCHTFNKQTGR